MRISFFSTLTLGLIGAWLFAPERANAQREVPDQNQPASSRNFKPANAVAGWPKVPTPHPLRIDGAGQGIVGATVTGPVLYAPELFQGFEDYYHPRLKKLREDYQFDKVLAGETNEFQRILKLRHWVHSRWPIDNDQNFSGDAFAILEKAKTGAGFHCSHSMAVQHAALSAMGFVARYVQVDRNHEDFGRSVHHGVNEVWSNDYAKWVLLDAKYDIHFERDGVPLSALELHEAVRADGGRGIVMVRGVERTAILVDESQRPEASIRSYWWVCYPVRQNPFTQPDFAARERLVIFDNEAFRKTIWHRDQGAGLTRHWGYAAGAFVPTADRTQIEWTPGVADLRIRQTAAELEVQIRSATPNLETCVVRLNGGQPQTVADGRVQWKLRDGENTLQVRTRNLFGVLGPSLMAAVSYKPADGPKEAGQKASGRTSVRFFVDSRTNSDDPEQRMAYGLNVTPPWPDGGSVFINLPEHLEYMPGTHGIARHHDARRNVWQVSPDGTEARYAVESLSEPGVFFCVRACAGTNQAFFQMSITNRTAKTLKSIRPLLCFQYHSLKGFPAANSDNFAHTFVVLRGKPVSVGSQTVKNPQGGARMAQVDGCADEHNWWAEKLGGMIEQRLDGALTILTAREGDRKIAVRWHPGKNFLSNRAIPCLHADPCIGDLAPGDTRTVQGELFFTRASLEQIVSEANVEALPLRAGKAGIE